MRKDLEKLDSSLQMFDSSRNCLIVGILIDKAKLYVIRS